MIETEGYVRVWCWIGRPLGRDWVCVWRGAGNRGDSGEAGEYELRVGGRGPLRLIRCAPRSFRNGAHLQTFHTGQSLQGQPPPTMLCLLERTASVRPHAYACGRVRVSVCVRACVGLHVDRDLATV